MIALLGSLKPPLFMMRLTILGFGNQAKSWAQNLKDSGVRVRVALRPTSPSRERCARLGFEVVTIGTPEFFEDAVFALLTPDDTHHLILESVGKDFKSGSLMLYAHGYSCTTYKFQDLYPDLKHILFAPKAIGTALREEYLRQGKLGAVYSLEHIALNKKKDMEEFIQDFAKNLGISMGPFPTSFEREMKADLFSEQGLLCSLLPYVAQEMFQTLVDDGVEKELAYFECWHEMKLIAGAMVDAGPEAFFKLISPNALIGSEKGLEKLLTPDFKKNLRGLYEEIKSGDIHKEFEVADANKLRDKITSRWKETELQKTFNLINEDSP
jgi:ketol-acid reductoisomerase